MDAEPSLYLAMEVAGCPTPCLHCWAVGKAYPHLSAEDIEWVLDVFRNVARSEGLAFTSYPMHEVLAHPEAPRVLDLFRDVTSVDPLATTGVPIATRQDWQEVLDGVAAASVRGLVLAFHGLGEVHDQFVNRRGAFLESCTAIERAKSQGLHVYANVFVTKASAPQMEDFPKVVPLDSMYWEVAGYTPTPRGRHYETLRADLGSLLPVAEVALRHSETQTDFWGQLEDYTEAAYVQKAMDHRDDPDAWNAPAGSGIWLTCRSNLDLYTGDAGHYMHRHGRLARPSAEDLVRRAIAEASGPYEAMMFRSTDLPSPKELAVSRGNRAGTKVYQTKTSMRWRWLDSGRAA